MILTSGFLLAEIKEFTFASFVLSPSNYYYSQDCPNYGCQYSTSPQPATRRLGSPCISVLWNWHLISAFNFGCCRKIYKVKRGLRYLVKPVTCSSKLKKNAKIVSYFFIPVRPVFRPFTYCNRQALDPIMTKRLREILTSPDIVL